MSGYVVEAKLVLDDRGAYASINRLIAKVESLDKMVNSLNGALARTTGELSAMSVIATRLGKVFADMSTELTGVNTRLTNLATRTLKAADNMDLMQQSGLKSTFVMADMVTEAENLSNAMRTVATTTAQARTATASMRNVGMGGGSWGRGGYRGGSRGGGEHGQGLMGLIGAEVAGLLDPSHLINAGLTAMIGMDLSKEALRPAMEYEQRFNAFKMMARTPEEQHAAQVAVQRTTELIPTTTYEDNMQTYKELKGIFVHGNMASEALPMFQKLKTAMVAASGSMPEMQGHESEVAQTIAKTAEMLGRANSPKELESFANNFMRSYISSGTLTKPGAYAQAIKTMRSARYGKDDEFLFGVLPYMVQEMSIGGGRGGIGQMIGSLNRMLGGGVMTKNVAEGLVKLGELPGGTDLKTDTIHTLIQGHKLQGASLFAANPFEWATTVHKKNLAKHFGMSSQQFDALPEPKKLELMNQITGGAQQTAQDALMQFIIQEKFIRRHIELLKTIPGLEEQYNTALATTGMKLQETGAQFHNLLTVLGTPVLKALNPILDGLVSSMQQLQKGLPNTMGQLSGLTHNLEHVGSDFVIVGNTLKSISDNNPTFLQTLNGLLKFVNDLVALNTKFSPSTYLGPMLDKAINDKTLQNNISKMHIPSPVTAFATGGLVGLAHQQHWLDFKLPPPPSMDFLAPKNTGARASHSSKTNNLGGAFGLIPPPPPSTVDPSVAGMYPAAGIQTAASHLDQASAIMKAVAKGVSQMPTAKGLANSAIMHGATTNTSIGGTKTNRGFTSGAGW